MTTIAPNRLQRSEHYYANYAVVLPHGHSFDDALSPDYWSHVGSRLRQHDVIRVIPEDGSYFAELLVLSAGSGFAKVKALRQIPLEEDGEPIAETEPVYVKWQGPHVKHAVIRRSDGERLKEGFSEKKEAEQWARDYLSAQNR